MTALTGGYTEVPVHVPPPVEELPQCKVYRRRWLILTVFIIFSLGNAAQWLEYASISNVVTKFYNVSSYAVDWTSIIFMLTYIIFIFPASCCLTKWGLRKCVIVGAGGTALGTWIKCASLDRDLFWVTFVGQTIVAISQVFLLQLPPEVASVWFGSDQVSTACSIGVFGNMLGVALSFLLTPVVVRNHSNMDDVGSDLARLYYFMAGYTTLAFILIVTLFQDKPPLPPSVVVAKRNAAVPEFIAPLKRLFKNPGFNLLMLTYGLSLGIFNAFSTLLNQLVLLYFEDGQEFAGRVGLLFIVGGMVGSVTCGVILDKTHRFKETTLTLYALAAASLLAITFLLASRSHTAVYIAGAVFGISMGSYLPVGLEFGAEITYPESEGTTSGILLAGSQITGVLFTVAYAWLIKVIGDVWANVAMVVVLVVGTGLTAIIKPDLKRQAANMAALHKQKDDEP
ncbi:heme transporter FLVCR2 isoform X1 [Anabrus simplex]|uniref:heme transporter FLVCR2 isoform X1 n=1 Tax=Anabrus simplex TaxID=316456 RepID=UPI0035A34D40